MVLNDYGSNKCQCYNEARVVDPNHTSNAMFTTGYASLSVPNN
jgi:hypothetical protein